MGRRPVTPLRSPVHLFRTAALVAALALAGCSGPGASQQPTTTTLHLSEYKITPAQLSLDAGIYTFTAINDGTSNHAVVSRRNGLDSHTNELAFDPRHSDGFT